MAGQIFVSVASYRDSQCQYTLRDAWQPLTKWIEVVLNQVLQFELAASSECMR